MVSPGVKSTCWPSSVIVAVGGASLLIQTYLHVQKLRSRCPPHPLPLSHAGEGGDPAPFPHWWGDSVPLPSWWGKGLGDGGRKTDHRVTGIIARRHAVVTFNTAARPVNGQATSTKATCVAWISLPGTLW